MRSALRLLFFIMLAKWLAYYAVAEAFGIAGWGPLVMSFVVILGYNAQEWYRDP